MYISYFLSSKLHVSLTTAIPFADSYKTLQCVEKNKVPPNIAFYVYMSRTFKALSIGQPFLFDAVETNIGNGYDRKTGIFTAHPKVCMHFRGPYTPRARTMPDPEVSMERWRQY